MVHADYPWLTPKANEIIESKISKEDIGLEYGSGRSTIWFARRVAYLTSVEHNLFWFEKIKMNLEKNNQNNVNLIFNEVPKNSEYAKKRYVGIADNFPDRSLDFVLIDGLLRDECALKVLGKIKLGGILIIDNINWYLPSYSIAPNSKTIEDGPASKNWKLLAEFLKHWRCLWTSSGVTDTAIYLK